MATMITSECINCGACEPECPNTAIYQGAAEWCAPDGTMHPALSQEIFYIVPEKCTECVGFHEREACAAVCPVDVCVPDPDIPETHDVLLARARALHPEQPIPDDAPSRFRTGGTPAPPVAAPAAAPPPGPAVPSPPAAAPPPPASVAAAEAPKGAAPPDIPAAPVAATAAPGEAAAASAAAAKAAAPPGATAAAKPPRRPAANTAAAEQAAAAPPVTPKVFPYELAGDFEQVVDALAGARRRQASPGGGVLLALLAAGQGVLGALGDGTKRRIESTVGNPRRFDARRATAANVLLDLLLYPVLCVGLGVVIARAGLVTIATRWWVALGIVLAVAEAVWRLRESLFRGVPLGEAPLRGAVWGPLLAPLGALGLRLAGRRETGGGVGFDGFHGGQDHFDGKLERARRYGEVYRLVDGRDAYLLEVEFPRRVPPSSLGATLGLPAAMPDYDYDLTLENGGFTVHARVVDPRVRRITGAAPAFPSDFTTRVPLPHPVTGFRHRYRDKTLEVVFPKASSAA